VDTKLRGVDTKLRRESRHDLASLGHARNIVANTNFIQAGFNNVAVFSQAQDTKANTLTHNVSATLCPPFARALETKISGVTEKFTVKSSVYLISLLGT